MDKKNFIDKKEQTNTSVITEINFGAGSCMPVIERFSFT